MYSSIRAKSRAIPTRSPSPLRGLRLQTRDCALMCEKSGYGIVTADKKFLKFDPDGNAKVLAALKASDKEDHLRVNVSGDVPGDTIKVTSVKLL